MKLVTIYNNPNLIEKFWNEYTGKGFNSANIHFCIYLNPTLNELRDHIPVGARGWISPQGNLCVEGYDDLDIPYDWLIHVDILRALKNLGVKITEDYVNNFHLPAYCEDPLTFGWAVQREGNGKLFCRSESYKAANINKQDLGKLQPLVEKKNPLLTFNMLYKPQVDNSYFGRKR